ncbi:MAG: transposase [Prochloraceae cyanobacterium]
MSRKVKGSNNWKQAVARVSKLHEKIANTRRDFHFKLAHRLCDQAGMIFAEDLGCKALAKSMLAKHCLDAGWGQFLNILEW